jgi:hypothetical protein
MIQQMRTLLRLKELKEQESARVVNVRRNALATATQDVEAAVASVAHSKATYSRREDGVYEGIIGRVVDLGAIEDTKAKVAALEKQHEILVDEAQRADHVKARAAADLDAAMAELRKSMKDKDKYVILTDELKHAAEEEASQKEEIEIEDLVGGRRREQGAS